jgi:hypothetical protein
MAQKILAEWKVNSFTTKDDYLVRLYDSGRWTCGCLGWRFSKGSPKPDCKHILKVKAVEVHPFVQQFVPTPQINTEVRAHGYPKAKPKPIAPPIVIGSTETRQVVIQTHREICLEEDY